MGLREEGEREVMARCGGRAGWSACAQGDGTAQCDVEAEHAHTLQTTARVPVAAALHEGYAERTLSVRRCPG
jgi:hypothetical protein